MGSILFPRSFFFFFACFDCVFVYYSVMLTGLRLRLIKHQLVRSVKG